MCLEMNNCVGCTVHTLQCIFKKYYDLAKIQAEAF
jgi:hypothetical protein